MYSYIYFLVKIRNKITDKGFKKLVLAPCGYISSSNLLDHILNSFIHPFYHSMVAFIIMDWHIVSVIVSLQIRIVLFINYFVQFFIHLSWRLKLVEFGYRQTLEKSLLFSLFFIQEKIRVQFVRVPIRLVPMALPKVYVFTSNTALFQ